MMIKHYKGEPNVYVIRYRSGKHALWWRKEVSDDDI